MVRPSMLDLLRAGVHFGHQTRRWNPKMRRYIFGDLDGIHIIDLEQTEALLGEALDFVSGLARQGGTILFVGTKKQARETVRESAESCDMPYVNYRWLGGLLTNFKTISQRIQRLHELNELGESGQLDLLPVRERLSMSAERERLHLNLGGVGGMERLPNAAVVVDIKAEAIAVHELSRLGIPMIGLVDTNCDPGPIEYVIPANDDAIRSCDVILSSLASGIAEGRQVYVAIKEKERQEAEEKARREAEEKARREAEEKARREAEEKARQEAEAEARREADEKARREAQERADREAEEKARKGAEEKEQREAEEKARRGAQAKAWQEAQEEAQSDAGSSDAEEAS